MNSFQNIIDRISEALSFFDFSFIVSGSVTYGAICYYLWNLRWLTIPDNTFFVTTVSIVLIYVCGLVSFILGKKIRLEILKLLTTEDSGILKKSYDYLYKRIPQSEDALELLKRIPQKDGYSDSQLKLEYTMMWIALRECKECKKTVAFINRFWVMQAVCEGLLFSSIVVLAGGVLSMFYLIVDFRWCMLIQYMLCIIAGGIGIYAFYQEGRRYAESQIQEVVVAYYKYISKE